MYTETLGLKGQVCSLACELAATWRWPTLAQMNHSELSHMARAVDDSTINIVEVIIIIIIDSCLLRITSLFCLNFFMSTWTKILSN